MTDIEVYQQPSSALAVTSDVDSWAQVAGSVIKLANEIYNTPFVPDGLRGSAPAVALKPKASATATPATTPAMMRMRSSRGLVLVFRPV